jgi:FkbM family methyltransferase
MKYIYFDLGAFDGDTVKHFLRKRTLPVKPSEFEIQAFEPNPNLKKKLREVLETKHKGDWSIDSRAVWIDNNDREFAVDSSLSAMGSTVMPGKAAIWDTMEHITVGCIDFSEYLKSYKDSYNIVKMDIEGAEFPVLEKMLADGTLELVNELWCEFHPGKVKEYTTEDQQDLVRRLREVTKVVLWH